MEKKVIWNLTDEECREIEDLFEKKNAYENLAKIIDASNDKMYQKLISDYSTTVSLFNKWWNDNSKKYKWQGQNWVIDFENKQVLGN